MSKTDNSFRSLATIVTTASSIIRAGAGLYLPAIPIIAEVLNISDSNMGLTLIVYFIVFSVFILIAGPLSDAYGRKKIILLGIGVFSTGSLICGLAGSFGILLTGRIIQAVGASMIPGTSRAAVRDVGNDLQVISVIGWMSVLGSIMLVGAPIIGGIITQYFHWSGNFFLLSVLGFMILIMTTIKMRESLPKNKRIQLSIRTALQTYTRMLSSAKFLLVLLPVVLCFLFQGIYLVTAPFIFMREFSLSPVQFGMSNIIIVIALAIGRYISMASVRRSSTAIGYKVAAYISLISVLFFGLILFIDNTSLILVFISIGVFATAFGTLSPIGMKESITIFSKQSGMASALQGSLLLGATAFGSGIASFIMKILPEISALQIFAYSSLIIVLVTTIVSLFTARMLVLENLKNND